MAQKSNVRFFEVTEKRRNADLSQLVDTKVLKIEFLALSELSGKADHGCERDATEEDKVKYVKEYEAFLAAPKEAEFQAFVKSKEADLRAEFEGQSK